MKIPPVQRHCRLRAILSTWPLWSLSCRPIQGFAVHVVGTRNRYRSFHHRRGADDPHNLPSQPCRHLALRHSSSSNNNHDEEIPSLYKIADINLYDIWIDMVQQDKVSVETTVYDEQIPVRYGVRTRADGGGNNHVCQEFAEQVGGAAVDARIQQINQTLADCNGIPRFVRDGPFAAQLLLVRTLRPPPSPGFVGSTTSVPPPYSLEQDSFVTGTLQLRNRPRAAFLTNSQCHTPWDVYHNVSPVDARGHFLLLPALEDAENNWRSQELTPEDCHDLVQLASTISPVGSLLISFNSVGAGASQNHIHCHAWPAPPLPLLTTTDNDSTNDDNKVSPEQYGWDAYAVSRTSSMFDFVDLFDGQVEVTYLNYPCFCVELSSANTNYNNSGMKEDEKEDRLLLLGKSLASVLEAIGEAPFNIGIVNRPSMVEQDDGTFEYSSTTSEVDVYIFVRSQERSRFLPASKLGSSEMMGIFHVSSLEDLMDLKGTDDDDDDDDDYSEEQPEEEEAADEDGTDEDYGESHSHSHEGEEGTMARCLRDVSYEAREELWDTIKKQLTKLEEEEQ